MRRPLILILIALIGVALSLGLVPQDARAQALTAQAPNTTNPSFAPECHAATGLNVSAQQMVERARWSCDGASASADHPVAWLRFSDQSWTGEERPRFFFSRIARYETITFYALDADGTLRQSMALESDARPYSAGPVFQLALPEIRAETRAVIVRIQRPHSVPLLTEARLAFDRYHADWSQVDVMLLAFVIGMLVLPLILDVSFYVVLRERFVALHAAMVGSMIVYVLFAGGLIAVFADLPMSWIAVTGPLFWAIGCGISALFLSDFLERDALPRAMRRAVRAVGWWTILVPGFFALQLHATQPFDDRLYFTTFIPVILTITAAIGLALWRGSGSARFIAVAWAPIIVASCERMMRGFGVYTGASTLDQLLYIAVGIEVIVISLAIAARFLTIRQERDAALTEARMLEALSERDPLTGLMNRRAVTERFSELRKQGFDTLALVDLDKFKDINDRFGHQVGDRVLVACANALNGGESRNSIAVRIGGEEFVVLLKGAKTLERAEALRRSIPVRIAEEVAGLDRVVTGSMGVVVLPRSSAELSSFADLYARTDQLLYQAKASGRNRMCYERLTVFTSAPPTRALRKNAA